MRRMLRSFALVSTILLVFPQICFSQKIQDRQAPTRNSVFLELGGNGFVYSINYDRRFSNRMSGRAGLMILSGESEGEAEDRVGVAIVPVMANYLIGTGSHRLELGLGPVFAGAAGETEDFGDVAGGGVGVTSTMGYRYQPSGGGFLFRAGLTPFAISGEVQFWGGLSIGYTF